MMKPECCRVMFVNAEYTEHTTQQCLVTRIKMATEKPWGAPSLSRDHGDATSHNSQWAEPEKILIDSEIYFRNLSIIELMSPLNNEDILSPTTIHPFRTLDDKWPHGQS